MECDALADLRRRRLAWLAQQDAAAGVPQTQTPQTQTEAQLQSRAAPAVPPPPPPPPPAPPSERLCRICFGDESTGRLFSPCRCRGTSQWVHPGCLADWRTLAPNAASFTSCSVCGFVFSTRTAAWAGVLQSRPLLLFATWGLLLALLAAGAVLARAASALGSPAGTFYGLVAWRPPWHDPWAGWMRLRRHAQALDALVTACVACGLAGTAAAAHERWVQARFLTTRSRTVPSLSPPHTTPRF